ncbi:oxidoreductase [Paenibacillus agaridevorans]|uniref:Oxidoreductase n=1 Tax=Paenibacillus agaridevorans TaxID=171404 RepID=A0A2R5ERA0_9BACL|nr:Gfo/Idh/MocA family oxidoreductase [Paenibacillus agaridevorans]GBG07568.1 oxidoreductase [Paenibacillus agaridevorans]
MTAKYRIAVVGGGSIAASHLTAIKEMGQAEACAVADIAEERAEQLAVAYNITPYIDYKEMIKTERPHIAIITLPHYLHKEAAISAAEQGCHILLEKPMAMNVQECDEIERAVRTAGVKLMVGHTQHYSAENVLAKKILQSGELGRLVMINDRRHLPYDKPQRPQWFFERAKAGGGILTNLGSHSIDKIQWLTGDTITKVRASVDYGLGRGDVEGGGLAYLETSGGIPAIVCQSGYPGAAIDETELLFTGGSLRLRTGIGVWISTGGTYSEVHTERLPGPALAMQILDLLHAVESGEEPECSMAYSRSVVAAVEGLYRSSKLRAEVLVQTVGNEDLSL